MPDIKQSKILIVATDGFEESELTVPQAKLSEAGATVHVAAPTSRQLKDAIRGWDKTDWGKSVAVDQDLEGVNPDDYDALVLPGGQINPDKLRLEPKALEIIKSFLTSGKVVAAICHAPWLLIETGAVKGRKLTSFGSIRTDVTNAGGHWVDEPVVTDGGIITSRKPDDLDAFCAKIIEEVKEGRHEPRSLAA
ncbi:type 1 glutamine amidotransferase domain-containing protein [Methylobacterium haplocladii]|uniref:Protease n=1 Tax=Methylobacterium haplocladii TaxID=1176176 RepID=A0A512IMM1_9HYPH|nr:type 1 glutamine amidotransferase domain-containing protein [Methylobacterium haplocladii]GEO98967.1 protease [Methylobacterium haplocladii]GJD84186.1 General stress protein 18 [Methylobacterium haplocladii]GLS59825.1 protease [Methylobacterium haplocladii]